MGSGPPLSSKRTNKSAVIRSKNEFSFYDELFSDSKNIAGLKTVLFLAL